MFKLIFAYLSLCLSVRVIPVKLLCYYSRNHTKIVRFVPFYCENFHTLASFAYRITVIFESKAFDWSTRLA